MFIDKLSVDNLVEDVSLLIPSVFLRPMVDIRSELYCR